MSFFETDSLIGYYIANYRYVTGKARHKKKESNDSIRTCILFMIML